MRLDQKQNFMQPFSAEANAMRLMRAKFGGLIPETITDRECLELMLKFSEMQDAYIENLRKLIDTLPPRIILLESNGAPL